MGRREQENLKYLLAQEEKKISEKIHNLQEGKAHSIVSKMALGQEVSADETAFLNTFIQKRQAVLDKWTAKKAQLMESV